MGMNMFNENEYISCNNCNCKTFIEKEAFTLKKINTPTGEKLQQEPKNKVYICTKCNKEITQQIKKYEIL